MSDPLIHLFKTPGDNESQLLRKIHREPILRDVISVRTEYCFNIELLPGTTLTEDEKKKLLWLLAETFEPSNVSGTSFLETSLFNESHANLDKLAIVEVGPRLAFTTAWSSNCVSICQACSIINVSRIERSRRYLLESSNILTYEHQTAFAALVHDRMTECVYSTPLTSFFNGASPAAVRTIPILSEGIEALKRLNVEQGLGFDDWDLQFYTDMFAVTLKRDPTDVEVFDLAQSNSEHSRHWFFGGNMVINGEAKEGSLFSMVKATLPKNSNSVIAFHDNSSAIQGFKVPYFRPSAPGNPSSMELSKLLLHPILTAETHNFPSGVAPFAGAETGTGGRLRDVQATGRGAHSLAGVSAYSVGNLHIPGHPLPWEQDLKTTSYPANLAAPLTIAIEASNGASDYGNKYGEPVVAGFCRSFGQVLPSGERVEYIKPIMFTAGVGILDDAHKSKGQPEKGIVVCKIGGPAYRIGVGGGAASSRVQGTTDVALDFNAVQRGDAEMENRMNRVIRACVELGEGNPLISIHDQGAGGNGNVLKEIVDPLGAVFDLRSIPIGDSTLSVSEIWGAEYQENNAFLVREEDLDLVLKIGQRENCAVSPVGKVTGDGRVVLLDRNADEKDISARTPYDLPLSLVLGNMPKKTFTSSSIPRQLVPLTIPSEITIADAFKRVVSLLDVGSKRFLTNKVDRCVTGLVAQQQCVGPYSMPLSNVAVLSLSYFDCKGMAVAVGEQPIKGLVNNAAQARMTVGEVLSNLVFARITALSDVKMSGNWMWAAKMEGEGAKMWEACEALKDTLIALGPSIDGGKDSLSMAAKVPGSGIVKSPGTMTLTAYAACPDITLTVTPDLKLNGKDGQPFGVLVFVDLARGACRCGGTALSTVLSQVGDISPDMNSTGISDLKNGFEATQRLLQDRLISSGHDRSDGGLLVTLAEMALAGNCGICVSLEKTPNINGAFGQLFNEELGWVLEVRPENLAKVLSVYRGVGVMCEVIGNVINEPDIHVLIDGESVFHMSVLEARRAWESTSFAIERLQNNPDCVAQEASSLIGDSPRKGLTYKLPDSSVYLERAIGTRKHSVAVIRQEGSNGDRELLSAFYAAGCNVWDVNMNDLVTGKIALDRFRGVAFSGGFSYADVNDSAKGWAGAIQFSPSVLSQFAWFRDQKDRFSLGVCNGCQLSALLGWVPFPELYADDSASLSTFRTIHDAVTATTTWKPELQPRFLHNTSGRFESRWTTVSIQSSPSVLLKGLEGTQLGIWVAHGEGRAHFPHSPHLQVVEKLNLAPIRYVDDDGATTMTYPANPNGSPSGIAAMCSLDGRHLALMPHPERCYQYWQWPYKPPGLVLEGHGSNGAVFLEDGARVLPSPWLKLFQNAIDFCDSC